jgi:hypothetical protein
MIYLLRTNFFEEREFMVAYILGERTILTCDLMRKFNLPYSQLNLIIIFIKLGMLSKFDYENDSFTTFFTEPDGTVNEFVLTNDVLVKHRFGNFLKQASEKHKELVTALFIRINTPPPPREHSLGFPLEPHVPRCFDIVKQEQAFP